MAGTTVGGTTFGDTASATSAGASSTTGAGSSCVDHDLGSDVGSDVLQAVTSGDDFTLMECVLADDGGGFVVDPPMDADDFVIVWTFPATGSFAISTVGSDAAIGLAPPSCDARILECEDQCAGPAASLVITGEAGDSVFLVIETYEAPGQFSLSITAGAEDVCIEDRVGASSTGGT
ncbi:MAG: hypothetical protein ACRBN8_39305 [Nannocystales bacterium]